MNYVVMYCRKCGLEVPSFNRKSDEGFLKAMNRLRSHMNNEHQEARDFNFYVDWFDRDKPEDKIFSSGFKENDLSSEVNRTPKARAHK